MPKPVATSSRRKKRPLSDAEEQVFRQVEALTMKITVLQKGIAHCIQNEFISEDELRCLFSVFHDLIELSNERRKLQDALHGGLA